MIKVNRYRKYLDYDSQFENYSKLLTNPISFALYYTAIMFCVVGILAGVEVIFKLVSLNL